MIIQNELFVCLRPTRPLKSQIYLWMKTIPAIVFLQLFIIRHAFAASSLFNLDNLNNQLSNNAILCMYQDPYGFMWIGTYDGLNLYDGHDVITFRFESGNPYSLSGNSIHRIMQADKDYMWVVTQMGLDKFSLKDRKVTESYPKYKKVQLIAANNKGEMWLITDNGQLACYDKEQRKILEIPSTEAKFQNTTSMFVDENEQLCLITKDGLVQMISMIKNTDPLREPYSMTVKEKHFHDKTINNVFYEDGQVYFIDAGSDLYIYDKAKDQKIFLRNLKKIIDKYGLISSLCPFQNDIFIAFIYSGLIKLNMAANVELEQINTTIGIFSLLKDRNQPAMWVATDGRGVKLYYKEKDTFSNILLEDLPFTARRSVRAIYTDENNTLWIGTKGDGIIKISSYDQFNDQAVPEENIEIVKTEKGEFKKPIYYFARSIYNQTDLWIGADELCYYSYKSNKIYRVALADELNWRFPDDIHSLCEINDSTLLVSSKGLYEITLDKKVTPYKVTNKKKQIFRKDGIDTDDFFYSMAWDGDSVLTLGSRKGYGAIRYKIPDKSYRFVSMENAHNKGLGDVISLYIAGKSTLYLGASSGLTQIEISEGKENEVKQFGRKDGIINDMIHGILEDNTGIVWLSTNKGLVKYNPQNESFFNVNSSKIRVYEFADNACWYCPFTHRLFFGGVNGLTWIEPKKEENLSDYEPVLLFTELLLYGKVQSLLEYNTPSEKEMSLAATQNTFQIKFTVLDYTSGDNYDYSYMLENYDTDWVPLQKENKISFTRLPPGEYTLKVKYKNDVVNAENKIFSLSFTILPPWYLSRLAYLLYITSFIFLLFLIYFYVKRKFRRKQELIALQIKQEQRERLYESKMKFFTNITHELYTPLTLINGALSQMSKTNQLDQIRKYGNTIQSNVASLNELIQEILDYRRIEEGRFDFQKIQRVSVTDLIADLNSSFMSRVTKNSIDLTVSVPENLYWDTDKSSLKKILTNLLSNAFKYTSAQGTIKVDVTEDKETLKIVVFNTGRGIEADRIKSIFSRFQILEDTETNASNELTARNGLGLSICYSLTKMLKGDISVRSEVNQFAEFTVILPKLIDNEKASGELPETNATIKVKQTKTEQRVVNIVPANGDNALHSVLIIDDNQEIVDLMSDILSVQYHVLKAYSVAGALQILKTQTPSLIITDIMMPETDGLSFIRMLRENRYNKHLPVIALSAKVDEADIVKGYETGADAYVTKPFSPDILLSVVERFLVNKAEIKNYYETAESAFAYNSGKLMHIEERKFIETLSDIVKENINNPELNSEFIAGKMKISSRNLYRQLKKILSVSLRDFIKDYRLSYAARLLLTTNMTIKEVIFKTGFSNKSYFYNEFFRKYNTSPKQYQETNKDNRTESEGQVLH